MDLINNNGAYTGHNLTNATNGTDDGNLQPPIYQIMNEKWLRAIFITLYAVIFLLGIGGNSLVVFIVCRNKAMQTITNIFITNLAVSDILMCLLAVPFTPTSAFIESWMFGTLLCHLVPMALGVCVYVSTLTSMAIAIDRYFVIVHPFKPRMSVMICLFIILAIWGVSISVSLPLAIYQKLSMHPATSQWICHEFWPNVTSSRFFGIVSLFLQYCIPCGIITMCYTVVSLKLRSRSRNRSSLVSRSRDRDELDIKRKRRTNRMLIAMVAIFVICWLPLNCMHLLLEYFYMTLFTWQYYQFSFFLTHVLAMSSTIYNPFLYAWMNENFKKEFRSVLPFLERKPDNLSTSRYTAVDNSQPNDNKKLIIANNKHNEEGSGNNNQRDNNIYPQPIIPVAHEQKQQHLVAGNQENDDGLITEKTDCNGIEHTKMTAVYDNNASKVHLLQQETIDNNFKETSHI